MPRKPKNPDTKNLIIANAKKIVEEHGLAALSARRVSK